MKNRWFTSLLIFLLLYLWVRGEGIGFPQTSESMARVQRLSEERFVLANNGNTGYSMSVTEIMTTIVGKSPEFA
ncbi:MAG: hypothetical protein PHO37_18595 [Kiritimatiellae bacterium]|nr:hypothetical protein [Kiritimatiellia bacterium]